MLRRRAAALLALAAVAAALPLLAAAATLPTEAECVDALQAARTEGNCSSATCSPDCVAALEAEVPLYCFGTQVLYNTSSAQATLNDIKADLKACGYNAYIGQAPLPFDNSTSVDTIIDYLLGICIGAVLMSLIFIILMAVPTLLSKAVAAPTILVTKGRRAVGKGARFAIKQGRAALQEGGEAVERGQEALAEGLECDWSGAMDVLKGKSSVVLRKSSAALAPALPPEGPGDLEAAAGSDAVATAAPPQAGGAAVDGAQQAAPAHLAPAAELSKQPAADAEPLVPAPSVRPELKAAESEARLQLMDTSASGSVHTAFFTWAVLALGLYIAALVLLILGTIDFVSNTVAATALAATGNTTVLDVLQWLIIGALILVGAADVFATWIVLAASSPTFGFRRWTFKNYLFSPWVSRYAFKIHVVVAGLVVLVLSVATILFGLGMLVVTLQLVTELLCSEVANVSVDGVRLSNICIQLPSVNDGQPMCGYDALQICYDITGMGVLTLVLGAMLLLWSHIIWLVLLLLSMWRFVDWNIAVAPGDASTTHGSATSLAVAPGAASASHGSASGLAAEAVARAQQAQQAQ